MRARGRNHAALARLGAATLGLALLTGLAAVAGIASTQGVAGTPAPASFRLAGGSVGCAFDADGAVTCSAREGAVARRLEPDGSSGAPGSGQAWAAGARVLLAGERWVHGEVSCLAGRAAIACSGYGGSIRVSE